MAACIWASPNVWAGAGAGAGAGAAGAGLGFFAGAALVVGTGLAMRWATNTILGELKAPTPAQMADKSEQNIKNFWTSRASIGSSNTAKMGRIMHAIEARRRGMTLDLTDTQKKEVIEDAKDLGIDTKDLLSVLHEANKQRNEKRAMANEEDLFL